MTIEQPRLGPYQLLRCIATGGMGEVWEAAPVGHPQTRLAVKTLRQDRAPSADELRRVEAEAQLGRRLNHPNIVHTLDFGVDAGRPFLVMELLQGWTLGRLFQPPFAPQSADLAVGIALQVLAALDYVSTVPGSDGKPLGLIHGDIKPANLFLTKDGVIKVIDFGIARAFDSSPQVAGKSAGGLVRGSLHYISPEQARNERLDARTDFYSLGLVMYELLVGRRAFSQSQEAAALSAILFGKLPPLRSMVTHVPPEVERLVTWAVQPNRADRPASALEFASPLRALVEDEGRAAVARAVRVVGTPREMPRVLGTDTLEPLFPEGLLQEEGPTARWRRSILPWLRQQYRRMLGKAPS